MEVSPSSATPMLGRLTRWFATRRIAVLLVAAALTVHLLSLALPILTLQVYDRILKYPGQGTLPVMIAGVIIAIALEWLVRTARSSLESRQSAALEHRMHEALVDAALSVRVGRAEMRSDSARLQDLSAVASLKDRYGGETAAAWVELPFMLVFLGFIAWLSGWLMLVPLTLMAGFATAAFLLGRSLRGALAQKEMAEEARDGLMLEALSTIHLVKAMTLERLFQRRYEAVLAALNESGFKVACWGGAIGALGAWCAQGMTLAVMAAGAPLVVMGHLSTGALVATILLSGRLMQPMQKALGLWTRAQEFQLAETRLGEAFAEPARLTQTLPETPITGKLICEGLRFSWNRDDASSGDAPLLDSIHFSIEPGESVHISARPGSGTTTLLKLMAGIYEPSEGEVWLDGRIVSRYPAAEAIRHVAYLPPAPVIYRGTVMENLTGFLPERQAAAVEMAGLLGIHAVILRLPQGYDTWLEGGSADLVPPGVAQRITIARALIEKPKLILFDQADRALDKDGYNHVFTLLGKLRGRASLVIVSGDHNLARFATTRLRLEHGQLLTERRNLAARPLVPLQELAG